MKIYLVRHGQTVGNYVNAYQDGTVELSEKGVQQTEFLAKRFSTVKIDLILASPYKRAHDTAAKIHQVTNKQSFSSNKEVIYLDLLKEIKRPSEFIGKPRTDPEMIKIRKEFESMYHDPNHHFSDEENFHDLKLRAEQFIEYLATRTETDIVVVSHMVYIMTLIGVMTLKENFTPEVLIKMYSSYAMENTGITICQTKENGDWQLITWNDHAHLAEVE